MYLALDTADNLLFFDDAVIAGAGLPAVNNLDVINLLDGTVTVLKSFGTKNNATFALQGLDIDVAARTLYLTSRDPSSAASADNAIYKIAFSVTGLAPARTSRLVR